MRVSTAGTYTTRLSQGRTVTATLPPMPEPITPSRWDVEVEDWFPGAGPTRTERVHRALALDTVRSWNSARSATPSG
ncbi:hypothetical protein ACQEV2_01080 [Streptomyces sp. CA-251387]|uniref:hypothetical protein n=1 Tax=Streptomyces sp. CA-251387 TaxID=3240064 RepID=UPI003D91A7E5